MKIKKDFIGMFDVLKGILMILIITIHTIGFTNDSLPADVCIRFLAGLYRYGGVIIALFFVLAGYSFKPAKNLKKHLKKQAKEFLLPYAIVVALACAVIAVRGALDGSFSVGSVTSVFFAGLYGATKPFEIHGVWVSCIVALWFPLAFFFSDVLYQLLWKIKNEKLTLALIWILTALGVLVPSDIASFVPWTLVQSVSVLGFIEVGRLIKKRKTLYEKRNLFAVLAVLAVWILLHIVSECNIGANLYRFLWLDYAVAAAAGVVFMKGYLASGLADAACLAPLEYIGRNSMWILYIHSFELVAFPWNAAFATSLPKGISPVILFLAANAVRIAFDVFVCVGINFFYGRYLNRKLGK